MILRGATGGVISHSDALADPDLLADPANVKMVLKDGKVVKDRR